jgi:limonene-1,2-epoxide hydrolase
VTECVTTTPTEVVAFGAMTDVADRNRSIVEGLWADLSKRDFAAVAARFTADGHYTDVPAPEDGAFGPAEIEARLRLGIEPLAGYECRDGVIIAEGNRVVTEHDETWIWDDEHQATLPFVSVMELTDDGRITRWWDYWDLQTIMGAAPEWWVLRVMEGYK